MLPTAIEDRLGAELWGLCQLFRTSCSRQRNEPLRFFAKAKEKNSVELDKKNPNRAILLVGNDDFPLPIPIVKRNGKRYFDTKTGRQEVLNRRVGANELDAIEICRGFVEAQKEYAAEKHDDSQVNQYAQRIISTPGKHGGLAWAKPGWHVGRSALTPIRLGSLLTISGQNRGNKAQPNDPTDKTAMTRKKDTMF